MTDLSFSAEAASVFRLPLASSEIKKTPRELRPKSHPLGVICQSNSEPGGPVLSWRAVVPLDSPAPIRSHPRSGEGERIRPRHRPSSRETSLISRAVTLISRPGFEVGSSNLPSRKVTNYSRNLGSQTRPQPLFHGLHCTRAWRETSKHRTNGGKLPIERADRLAREEPQSLLLDPKGSSRAGDLRVVEPRERQPNSLRAGGSPR